MATPEAPEPRVRGVSEPEFRYALFPRGQCSDGSVPLVWFSVPLLPGPGRWHARLVDSVGGRLVGLRVLGDTSAQQRLEAALARILAALERCRHGGRRWARVSRLEARVRRMLRREVGVLRAVVVADPTELAGFPDLRCGAPAAPPRARRPRDRPPPAAPRPLTRPVRRRPVPQQRVLGSRGRLARRCRGESSLPIACVGRGSQSARRHSAGRAARQVDRHQAG